MTTKFIKSKLCMKNTKDRRICKHKNSYVAKTNYKEYTHKKVLLKICKNDASKKTQRHIMLDKINGKQKTLNINLQMSEEVLLNDRRGN